MPGIQSKLVLSVAALALAAGSGMPAAAQALLLDEIVVTPNRTPVEKNKSGSRVETLDREAIEEKSLATVTDYLTLLPGIHLSPNGGVGTNVTTVIMRGARGQYVKTLVDGIDISDVSGTNVQANFGQFLAGGVERIEVLKNSQSTLYGSDAIAGVVSIDTLGGVDFGVRHRAFVEGGSFGTVTGGYGVDAGFDRGRFGARITGLRTDGISAARSGTERDGYDNISGSVGGRFEASEDLAFFANGLLINSRGDFDDGFGPPPAFAIADSAARFSYRQRAARAGVDFKLLDGRFANTLAVQLSSIDRESVNGFGTRSTFDGTRTKVDYLGSFEFDPTLSVNFGGEWERQEATTSAGLNRAITLAGAWVDAIYTPTEALSLTLGGRHSEHSQFGGYTTWRATGSYALAPGGPRLHSSVATGFRAPSLYELYDAAYGEPTLQPETSLGFDIGIEQRFLDDRLVADLTFFLLDIDNFIGFDPITFRNIQTSGTIRSRGIEASFGWTATDWLDLEGAYTFTRSKRPDGSDEVRIPKHDVTLAASLRPAERWTVSTTAKIALDTLDFGGKLDDYVVIGAKVAYKPNENAEIYVRAENLLDQDYQVVRGYGTPGFSVFAGIRASFGP